MKRGIKICSGHQVFALALEMDPLAVQQLVKRVATGAAFVEFCKKGERTENEKRNKNMFRPSGIRICLGNGSIGRPIARNARRHWRSIRRTLETGKASKQKQSLESCNMDNHFLRSIHKTLKKKRNREGRAVTFKKRSGFVQGENGNNYVSVHANLVMKHKPFHKRKIAA